MKVLTRMLIAVIGIVLVHGTSAEGAEDTDWMAIFASKGAYAKAAYAEMIAKCNTIGFGDGVYPNIIDQHRFFTCQGGMFYPMYCDEVYDFDTSCNCCSWPLETPPSYMKKCSSVSQGPDFCNCADNPNFNMRGAGPCSCNANGIGVNYSGCTATPPCPEIKDTSGVNRGTRDMYGRCYAPSDVPYLGASGTFEYPAPNTCYYTE